MLSGKIVLTFEILFLFRRKQNIKKNYYVNHALKKKQQQRTTTNKQNKTKPICLQIKMRELFIESNQINE